MNQTELVTWNKKGLIPGPEENETDFLRRVAFCEGLKDQLQGDELPADRWEGNELFIEAPLSITQQLYDIQPDWVPLFFSNWKLLPWHGGSAWIFQLEKEGPLGAVLQLRKAFYHQKKYLGLYDRDELISHEMAHAARMAFAEKEYEEIFAYQTSSKGLSAKLGPILQSSVESKWFVFLLGTLLLMDLFLLFVGSLGAYLSFQSLKLLPLLLVIYGAYRLSRSKRVLKITEASLSSLVGKEKARFVLFRLKDKEIKQFSTLAPDEILSYIHSENSPRIQMIRAAYFS
jgi:hypothetical protein